MKRRFFSLLLAFNCLSYSTFCSGSSPGRDRYKGQSSQKPAQNEIPEAYNFAILNSMIDDYPARVPYRANRPIQSETSGPRWSDMWDESLPSSDPWLEGTQGRRKKGENKSQSVIRRELGFARVKMDNAKMNIEEWNHLLAIGDAQALEIKKEFDAMWERNAKYTALHKKLLRSPHDQELLDQLKNFDRTEENFRRLKNMRETKVPMSKGKRDTINALIKKIRKEIEAFNRSGLFPSMRNNATERRIKAKMLKEEKRALDPKCEAGDAIADQVTARMEELRALLRQAPFDRSLWSVQWNEMDAWMRQNQTKYIQMIKPILRTDLNCIEGEAGISSDVNEDVEEEEEPTASYDAENSSEQAHYH